MRRPGVWLAVAVLAAGCGAPSSLKDQADEVSSTAAEGALLAHDAAQGDTTSTFTREHAKALRKKLSTESKAIDDRKLSKIAADVASELQQLEREPADEGRAAMIERRLESAAKAAEDVGKTA